MPKICEFLDIDGNRCKKQANHGVEHKQFCREHKLDGMLDLRTKKCIKCKKKSPTFGLEGGEATHCSGCKDDNMIDVKHKKCIKCKKKIPNFGLEGEEEATHCVKCKDENMINIISERCIKCEKTRPIFGLEGEKATHCAKCKDDNMVDVKNKRCIKCKKKQPIYGLEGESATHCSRCKDDNMIDVISKKCIKCKEKHPIYGLEGESATHCSKCKDDNMVDIKHKKCRANIDNNYLCPIRANKYYDGYCAHCFVHLFPNHPKSFNFRTKSKELKVVSHISSKFEGFIHDRPLYVDLTGGCCVSKRRIDLRKLINNTMLCIEVDEEQRKYHLEPARYDDLFMDFSGKYIFIRYNPDKYRDAKGKGKNPTFATRMKALETEIQTQIERIDKGTNNELVEILYLFYHQDKDDSILLEDNDGNICD